MEVNHAFGGYIDHLLCETTPADLPSEQPRKLSLFINLRAAKTATALGLNLPQSLLQRADQVIE